MHVKQYTPLDNLEPREGDVTIIAAHANGFPKELYEPLWDGLHAKATASGFKIRNIWIADVAHQGMSSILNESKLGNDPSWFDHARDLLGLINHFRNDIKKPIVGIGHSMGAGQLTHLSLLHPSLFETLVLIDPVIADFSKGNQAEGDSPAKMSAMRRDKWPSRSDAATSFKKSKFYQSWDPRVLQLWIQYGLRELPTKLYPDINPALDDDPGSREVTLTTTKHQEVFSFTRPIDLSLRAALDNFTEEEKVQLAKLIHQEQTHFKPILWDRPEVLTLFRNLEFIRPSVLYIFGETSYLSDLASRTAKVDNTGIGLGGSGGAKVGRVKQVLVAKAGHLIPMEKVEETAQFSADWIGVQLQRYSKNAELLKRFRIAMLPEERSSMSSMMVAQFKKELGELRNLAKKSKI